MRKLALLILLLGCTEEEGDDRLDTGILPNDATPTTYLSFRIGYTEPASPEQLALVANTFRTAWKKLWHTLEGQVGVREIVITDAAAPGSTSAEYAFLDSTTYDVLVWPSSRFTTTFPAVHWPQGRDGRLMALASHHTPDQVAHELAHFLFRLSWEVGPLLVDEYRDGIQDECLMESPYADRLCAEDNHVAQDSQPHACWTQILADYPNLTYKGINRAEGELPEFGVRYE